MTIKVLLVDDQFLILECVKAILEPEPGIEVVGTASDGQSAIALVKKLRPDVLLMDIEMPKMNGILATKYIRKYLPNTKIIVLTSHKSQDYIAEALLAGASGYLLKDNLIKDLKQEIYSFGRGYSSVKAKLLTQTAKKNSTVNVVENRQRTIYFKKYRKNIYKPAVNQIHQQSHKIYNLQIANADITKVSLARRSKPLTTKEIRATNLKTSSSPRFNRRKYQRRIIWLLLAISSIVLSIVIF